MAKEVTIDADSADQRLDNFLMRHLHGVPKSRIYRAVRGGEVRVNKGRRAVSYRLQEGDVVRIPPLRQVAKTPSVVPVKAVMVQLKNSILYEDDQLLVMNKPSGVPVHGGTGLRGGLISGLRVLFDKCKFLELVHRLDKETSGCLLIAKKRRVLVELHALLASRQVKKRYLLLVKGRWQGGRVTVKVSLKKNVLQSGERMVKVSQEGKSASTMFEPLQFFEQATLLAAYPKTGRTHQIRVHALHLGHPLAGDQKYGDREFNQQLKKLGLRRLFLHAQAIYCRLADGKIIDVQAPLSEDLQGVLQRLSGK